MTHPQFTPSLHPRWPAGHIVNGTNVGGKFMPKGMAGTALWAQQASAALAKKQAGASAPAPTKLVGPSRFPNTPGQPYYNYGVQLLKSGSFRSVKQWFVDDAQGNQHGPFGTQAAANNYHLKLTAPAVPPTPKSNMPAPPPAATTVPSGASVYTTKVVKMTAAGPRNMTQHWFDYQGTTYGPYATKATMQKQLAIATKPGHPVAKGKDLIGKPPSQHPNRLAKQVAAARPANVTAVPSYGGSTMGSQARHDPNAADTDLRSLADMQGFSDKPEVITQAEMNALNRAGAHHILYRGVKASGRAGQSHAGRHSKTAKQIQDQFRTGDAYYGVGVYGNGYYFGTSRGVAVGYSDSTAGSVVRVALPKNAKIGDYHILSAEVSKLVGHSAASPDTRDVFADVGRYAMARGYDALKVSVGYVILNRSILKVQAT